MSLETYLTFVLACVVIVIVPGPTVTVIVANSLRDWARAGLANVAGTQAALLLVLIGLAGGLQVIIEHLGVVFDWIRIIGAVYLIWLGIKLFRSGGKLGQSPDTGAARSSSRSYFWQGFGVLLSNPKALVFFGAFIPQFIDPAGNAFSQAILLGATFMFVATVLDSGYALAAGQAGQWLSRSRVRLVERISGCCMIAGGLWLALSRR
jgi:threonine/homoserine/homoserine lactone efflux protein